MLPTLSRVSTIARDTGTTEAQWRWWIFRAQDNGLAASGALMRVGRSVLIDRDKAAAWLESLSTSNKAA